MLSDVAMAETIREPLPEQRLRYLRRAEEAMAHAATAHSTELRSAYLKLSESWLALVHEIDAALQKPED